MSASLVGSEMCIRDSGAACACEWSAWAGSPRLASASTSAATCSARLSSFHAGCRPRARSPAAEA
eukprot:295624-Alexandrium_andersonii.AAC.1